MAFDAFIPKITLPANKTDIRKGDGIAMICNGKVMVVDSFQGGEPTDGIISWLKSNYVTQVDLAVATHAHGDHIGGFDDIVNAGIKIKEFRCYHIDSIRDGNDASREDSDNLLAKIRWLQKRGTRVLFVDHGDVLKFEDTSWHIFRKQPEGPAASDDPNAWEYVNNGSLVLHSPELEGMLPGDGPENPKEAIAYFQQKYGKAKILTWFDISHHGGAFSQSNAASAKNAGAKIAYESCVEDGGPGTTDWTKYGARRVVQQDIPVLMQDQNIYIHAAAGKITFKQGSKTLTFNVPYQGEEKEGWVKNAVGWWYRYKDGSWPAGRMVALPWSKGIGTFCFNDRGYMVTGWQHIDGTWYYFDKTNGDMKTGWVYDNGYWYYLGADGKMQTGWVTYKGKRCYLEPLSDKNHVQGTCYVNRTAVIGGKTYRFDKDGYATEEKSSGKFFLNGVDIASYQSGINPARLSTTDFVIVKFTQGVSYLNPHADRQYSTSKSAGKLLGAYHYAEGKDAKAEAQYFVRSLGSRVGECILALDWEGNQNSRFGSGQDVAWCKTFLDEVYRLTGVRALIYMSKSVCRRYNWSPVAQSYPLWCAQYKSNSTTGYQYSPWTDDKGFGAWDKDTIRQYSSHGRITGYNDEIDIDLAYMSAGQWRAMAGGKVQPATQGQREAIVSEAISHIGVKEGTVLHHKIIDRYNSRKPLPRGYAVKYTDPWCATFISYLAIVMGYTDIIPVECGCPQMITLAKQMGIWVEDDSYVPKLGDIVLYDWQDSGSGDNTGTADHIGLIEKVVGNTETVIEGNYQDSVKRRELAVNGRYIRGYIVPRYK